MVLLLFVSGYGWSCMLQTAVKSTNDPWLWTERAAISRKIHAPKLGLSSNYFQIVRPGDAANSGFVVDNKPDANYFADVLAECTPRYWHYRQVERN